MPNQSSYNADKPLVIVSAAVYIVAQNASKWHIKYFKGAKLADDKTMLFKCTKSKYHKVTMGQPIAQEVPP